jgi:hypothetical protein
LALGFFWLELVLFPKFHCQETALMLESRKLTFAGVLQNHNLLASKLLLEEGNTVKKEGFKAFTMQFPILTLSSNE